MMASVVIDWTRAGRASRMRTPQRICLLDAPIICAASILPGSTARRFVSTRRAKKGAERITSGTTVAREPVDLPTMSFVRGISMMMPMMKGSDRTMLTTKETPW